MDSLLSDAVFAVMFSHFFLFNSLHPPSSIVYRLCNGGPNSKTHIAKRNHFHCCLINHRAFSQVKSCFCMAATLHSYVLFCGHNRICQIQHRRVCTGFSLNHVDGRHFFPLSLLIRFKGRFRGVPTNFAIRCVKNN